MTCANREQLSNDSMQAISQNGKKYVKFCFIYQINGRLLPSTIHHRFDQNNQKTFNSFQWCLSFSLIDLHILK